MCHAGYDFSQAFLGIIRLDDQAALVFLSVSQQALPWPQHAPLRQQSSLTAVAFLSQQAALTAFVAAAEQPVLQSPVLQQSPLQAFSPQHLPSMQQADLAAAFGAQQAAFSALAELQPVLHAPVLQHSPLQALSPQHLPSVQQAALVCLASVALPLMAKVVTTAAIAANRTERCEIELFMVHRPFVVFIPRILND